MYRNLYVASVNTTQYGLRSLKFIGLRLWNSLPTSITYSKFLLFIFLLFIFLFYLIQYLSRGIQFSRASLNGPLTQHKTDIETKLDK